MENIIDVSTIFGFWPTRNIDISLNKLFNLMQSHNIDKVFTLSARGILIDAERGNEETLNAYEKCPDKIIPVATIDPRATLAANEAVELCCKQGFQHIRFFPDIQHWSADNLVWNELLDELIKQNFAILHLPASFGMSNIDKIAKIYPKPIIVHQTKFGQEAELILLLKRKKNVFFEISYFIGVGAIERLDKIGLSERILLGTNMPLNYPASAIGIVQALKDNNLKKKIFSENVKSLIGGP